MSAPSINPVAGAMVDPLVSASSRPLPLSDRRMSAAAPTPLDSQPTQSSIKLVTREPLVSSGSMQRRMSLPSSSSSGRSRLDVIVPRTTQSQSKATSPATSRNTSRTPSIASRRTSTVINATKQTTPTSSPAPSAAGTSRSRAPSVSERSQMSTAERLALEQVEAAAAKAAARAANENKSRRRGSRSPLSARRKSISKRSTSRGSKKKKSASKKKAESLDSLLHTIAVIPESTAPRTHADRVESALAAARARADRVTSPSPTRTMPRQPPLNQVLSPSHRTIHPPVSLYSPPPPTKEEMRAEEEKKKRYQDILARAEARLHPPPPPLALPIVNVNSSPRSKKKSSSSSSARFGVSPRKPAIPVNPRLLLQAQQKKEQEELLQANVHAREQVNKLKMELERKQAALRKQWNIPETANEEPAKENIEPNQPHRPIVPSTPATTTVTDPISSSLPSGHVAPVPPVPLSAVLTASDMLASSRVASTNSSQQSSPRILVSTTGDTIEAHTPTTSDPNDAHAGRHTRTASPALSPILKSHIHAGSVGGIVSGGGGGSESDASFTFEWHSLDGGAHPSRRKVAFLDTATDDTHVSTHAMESDFDERKYATPQQVDDDSRHDSSLANEPSKRELTVVEEEPTGITSPSNNTNINDTSVAESVDALRALPFSLIPTATPSTTNTILPTPLPLAPSVADQPNEPESPRSNRRSAAAVTSAMSTPPHAHARHTRRNSISSTKSGGSSTGDVSPRVGVDGSALKGHRRGGRYGSGVSDSPLTHHHRRNSTSSTASKSSTKSSSTISNHTHLLSTPAKKLKPRRTTPKGKSHSDDEASTSSASSSHRKRVTVSSKKKRKKGRSASTAPIEFTIEDAPAINVLPPVESPPTPPTPKSPPPPPLTDDERIRLGFAHLRSTARWSERINDGLIDALQLYRIILLRRALKHWRDQYMMFRHQSFFYQWRELTRSRIAQKLYHYTLARRTLAHWILTARYAIGIPPLRERWNKIRRIELLKKMYDKWREAYWSGFYAALNAYANKMFIYLQTRRCVREWSQWNRQRQLVRKAAEAKVRELRRKNWYIRWHQVINLGIHREMQVAQSKQFDWRRIMGDAHRLWRHAYDDRRKAHDLVRLERKYAMSQMALLAHHWRRRVQKTLDLRRNFDTMTQHRMMTVKRTLFQRMWNWFCAILYQRNRQLTVVRHKYLRRWITRACHPEGRQRRAMRIAANQVIQRRVSLRVHDLIEHWIYYKNVQQHFRAQTRVGIEWSDGRGALLNKAVWWSQWKRQIHRRFLGRTGELIHKQNRKWAMYAVLKHWSNINLMQLRKRQNYEAAFRLHKRNQLRLAQGALDRWWMAYERVVRAPINLINLTRTFKQWRAIRDETQFTVRAFRRATALRTHFRSWYALFAQLRGIPNVLQLRRLQRDDMFDRNTFGFGGGGGARMMYGFSGLSGAGGAGGFHGFHQPHFPASQFNRASFGLSAGVGGGFASGLDLPPGSFPSVRTRGDQLWPSQPGSSMPDGMRNAGSNTMRSPIIREENSIDLERMLDEMVGETNTSMLDTSLAATTQSLPSGTGKPQLDKFTFYDPSKHDPSLQRQSSSGVSVGGSWRSRSNNNSNRSSPTGSISNPNNLGSRRFPTVVIPEEKTSGTNSAGGGGGGRAATPATPATNSGDITNLRKRGTDSPQTAGGTYQSSASSVLGPNPPSFYGPDADRFVPSSADAEWQFQSDFDRGMAEVERPTKVQTTTGSFTIKRVNHKKSEYDALEEHVGLDESLHDRNESGGAPPLDVGINWPAELNPLAYEEDGPMMANSLNDGERDEFDLEVSRQERETRRLQLDANEKNAQLEEAKKKRIAEEDEARKLSAAAAAPPNKSRHTRTASEPVFVANHGVANLTSKPASQRADTTRRSSKGHIKSTATHALSDPTRAKAKKVMKRAKTPAPRRVSFVESSPNASFRRSQTPPSRSLNSSFIRNGESTPPRIQFLSDSFIAPLTPSHLLSPPAMTLDDIILKTPIRDDSKSPRRTGGSHATKLFGSPRQMAKALTRQYNTSHPTHVRAPGLKHVQSLLGFEYVAPPNLQIQHPSEMKPPLPLAAQAKSKRIQIEKEREERAIIKEQARQLKELEHANHFARMRDALGPAAEAYMPSLSADQNGTNRFRGSMSASLDHHASRPSTSSVNARSGFLRRVGRSSMRNTRSQSRSRSRPRPQSSERSAWLLTPDVPIESAQVASGGDAKTEGGGSTQAQIVKPRKSLAWSIAGDAKPLQSISLNTARPHRRSSSTSASTRSSSLSSRVGKSPARPPTDGTMSKRARVPSRTRTTEHAMRPTQRAASKSRSPHTRTQRTNENSMPPPPSLQFDRTVYAKPAIPSFRVRPTTTAMSRSGGALTSPGTTARRREESQLKSVEHAWKKLIEESAGRPQLAHIGSDTAIASSGRESSSSSDLFVAPPSFPLLIPSFPVFVPPIGRTTVPPELLATHKPTQQPTIKTQPFSAALSVAAEIAREINKEQTRK